ncbi:hypothetical protein YC2023_027002 [Brassica napus]
MSVWQSLMACPSKNVSEFFSSGVLFTRLLPGESHVQVMKSFYDFVKSQVRIGVQGYNMSSLQPLDLVRSLSKLSGSLQVPRVRNAISGGFTVFVLRGEAAEEKALALDGTDIEDGSYLLQSRGISVTGYDPSLHVDVVKSDLTNRFSSCGKITDVFVLKSRALIYLFGIGAVDMALRLCRRGDSVLRAKALPNPKRKINHYRA